MEMCFNLIFEGDFHGALVWGNIVFVVSLDLSQICSGFVQQLMVFSIKSGEFLNREVKQCFMSHSKEGNTA